MYVYIYYMRPQVSTIGVHNYEYLHTGSQAYTIHTFVTDLTLSTWGPESPLPVPICGGYIWHPVAARCSQSSHQRLRGLPRHPRSEAQDHRRQNHPRCPSSYTNPAARCVSRNWWKQIHKNCHFTTLQWDAMGNRIITSGWLTGRMAMDQWIVTLSTREGASWR